MIFSRNRLFGFSLGYFQTFTKDPKLGTCNHKKKFFNRVLFHNTSKKKSLKHCKL